MMAGTAEKASASREIPSGRPFEAKRFFLQWEWLLVLTLIAVNLVNADLSPHYFVYDNIMNAIQMFLDKAILVFPMMMVILLGQIDISVASTMALSSVIMGVAFKSGAPMPAAILTGLAVGGVCGFINGYILAEFRELASMIITLGTMILYRGIASIILENRAVSGFPVWFSELGWGTVLSLPVILLFFIAEAAVFAYAIHCTTFGRSLYAIGFNENAARFSGVNTKRVTIAVYTVMGVFAAVSGIFLASKMGSVRPSMAKGYELDVIAMVVLGGVSTSGGRGRVIGVLLSIFIIGLLRYGLGITNVPAPTILIIIGTLLVAAVSVPNIRARGAKPRKHAPPEGGEK
jgi:rhamnose transport system permease protein